MGRLNLVPPAVVQLDTPIKTGSDMNYNSLRQAAAQRFQPNPNALKALPPEALGNRAGDLARAQQQFANARTAQGAANNAIGAARATVIPPSSLPPGLPPTGSPVAVPGGSSTAMTPYKGGGPMGPPGKPGLPFTAGAPRPGIGLTAGLGILNGIPLMLDPRDTATDEQMAEHERQRIASEGGSATYDAEKAAYEAAKEEGRAAGARAGAKEGFANGINQLEATGEQANRFLPNISGVVQGAVDDVMAAPTVMDGLTRAARGSLALFPAAGVDLMNTGLAATQALYRPIRGLFTGEDQAEIPRYEHGGGMGWNWDKVNPDGTKTPTFASSPEPKAEPEPTLEDTPFTPHHTPVPGGMAKTYTDGKGSWAAGVSTRSPEENAAIAGRLADRSYQRDHAGALPQRPGVPNYGAQQGLYEEQVARAKRARAAPLPTGPSWSEAAADYAAGRVGSEGYKMFRNLTMKIDNATQSYKGTKFHTPESKALQNFMTSIVEGVGDSIGNSANASRTTENPLDAQRFLLDQSKFGYQQAKDDRQFALDRQEADIEKAKYMDERMAGFMDNFTLRGADKNVPVDTLRAWTARASQEYGIAPEQLQAALQQEYNRMTPKARWDKPFPGKIDWNDPNTLEQIQQNALSSFKR